MKKMEIDLWKGKTKKQILSVSKIDFICCSEENIKNVTLQLNDKEIAELTAELVDYCMAHLKTRKEYLMASGLPKKNVGEALKIFRKRGMKK